MTDYRGPFPNHMLESFGAHVEDGTWWDDIGGYYVGHADWRDEYGQGTRTYCGHKHSGEDVALECIKRRYEVREPGTPLKPAL
jgi:hypothetical protein